MMASSGEEIRRVVSAFGSEMSVRIAVVGTRIAIVFGGAFLGVCVESYPTYNVLEVAPDALSCHLASVAHHHYVHMIFHVGLGVACSMVAFLMGFNVYKTFLFAGEDGIRRHVVVDRPTKLFIYLPLILAVLLYGWSVKDMATFIGDSAQPALLRMHHPLDGYACPSLPSSAGAGGARAGAS